MMHQDLRHVDVAILYGQGQTERAQHIARQLKPLPIGEPKIPSEGADFTDAAVDISATNYVLSKHERGER